MRNDPRARQPFVIPQKVKDSHILGRMHKNHIRLDDVGDLFGIELRQFVGQRRAVEVPAARLCSMRAR